MCMLSSSFSVLIQTFVKKPKLLKHFVKHIFTLNNINAIADTALEFVMTSLLHIRSHQNYMGSQVSCLITFLFQKILKIICSSL